MNVCMCVKIHNLRSDHCILVPTFWAWSLTTCMVRYAHGSCDDPNLGPCVCCMYVIRRLATGGYLPQCMYVCNYWSRHRPLKPLDGFDPACMYVHPSTPQTPQRPHGAICMYLCMYVAARVPCSTQAVSKLVNSHLPNYDPGSISYSPYVCMYVRV